MIFHGTKLEGAFVIEMAQIKDERGWFARAWCQKEFEAHGLNAHLVQANQSHNRHRGTLRGLHYQVAPFAETKLVRCLRGSIHDVIVDLRPASPTFRQWIGVELSAANGKMLYVPEGFGHGFQTLEGETDVFYQVTQFYMPTAERGVRWDDPALAVQWPEVENRLISEKDRNWPPLSIEPLPPLPAATSSSPDLRSR